MASHRSILNDIEANLPALEIDEIKKRLDPLMKGCRIESPVFDPGHFYTERGELLPRSASKLALIAAASSTLQGRLPPWVE
jgi:hypothetical protein